jgi:hypothetical protein
MSFIMFAVVGLSVGVVLYGIAWKRFDFALPLGFLIGLLSAFLGGVIGNLIAGHPLGQIRPASAGGTAIGGFIAIAAMAILSHRRHLEQEGELDGKLWSLAPARRRTRA